MWKKELIKNKLFALIFLAIGSVLIAVDGDGTFFVLAMVFAIPLFFSKKPLVD